ncbi:MAG: type II toxin-antitoxin system VapC family toxin [Chloroflexi bacterium]|nr:type II toxin-antitoxin system VapC family toxin [Chloroflexota bacterium]
MLVQNLTGDPPDLADVSAEVIDGVDELLVAGVVIAETASVLTSVYEVPRAAVFDGLIALLSKANIDAFRPDKDLVLEALLCRSSGRVSFADALVWAAARSEANAVVYSLDGRFPDEGITVLRSAVGGSS